MKNNIQTSTKSTFQGFLVQVLIIGVIMLFAFIPMPDKKAKTTVPSEAEKVLNPIPSTPASLAEGKEIYQNKCTSCHGIRGKGDGPKSEEFGEEGPQNFTKADFQKQTDGAIFWIITSGEPDPMPCFRNQLTKYQCWQVINYIRTL